MKCRKNKVALLLLCLFALFLFSLPKEGDAQLTFLKSHGGKAYPRWGTICLGLDPAFDIKPPNGGTEGPFAITPLTDRNKFWTIWGAPGRSILLTAARFKIPMCLQPCEEGMCPFSAYGVYQFGISLIPSL